MSKGLTADLTTFFSKVPGLFVIAGSSVEAYKSGDTTVKEVAEELGARYVLQGSVRKAGEELRINIQLVDALSGRQVWGERFDRAANDIFAVQDEIIKHVIVEMQVELTEGDRAKTVASRTENLQAWLLRSKAHNELMIWTRESMIRAREYYQAAHDADPTWAAPLAGIAYTHWYEAKLGWSNSPEKSVRLAREFAERAVESDPDTPEGYQALGNVYFLLGEPERAIALRQKAIELAPNDFSTLAGLAIRLNEFGREEQAVRLFERAIRVSPKHPWWVPAGYGLSLHLTGRKEEAVKAYQRAMSLGSEDPRLLARLAALYIDLGRHEEAQSIADKALDIEPEFTVSSHLRSYPISEAEQKEWYKDLMVRAGLPG